VFNRGDYNAKAEELSAPSVSIFWTMERPLIQFPPIKNEQSVFQKNLREGN
jgi:hypothetical protein